MVKSNIRKPVKAENLAQRQRELKELNEAKGWAKQEVKELRQLSESTRPGDREQYLELGKEIAKCLDQVSTKDKSD